MSVDINCLISGGYFQIALNSAEKHNSLLNNKEFYSPAILCAVQRNIIKSANLFVKADTRVNHKPENDKDAL